MTTLIEGISIPLVNKSEETNTLPLPSRKFLKTKNYLFTFISFSLTHLTVNVVTRHVHFDDLLGQEFHSERGIAENYYLLYSQLGEEKTHTFNFLLLFEIYIILGQTL